MESVIGSVVPEDGKLLVLANGGYGDRIVAVAVRLKISVVANDIYDIEPEDIRVLLEVVSESIYGK